MGITAACLTNFRPLYMLLVRKGSAHFEDNYHQCLDSVAGVKLFVGRMVQFWGRRKLITASGWYRSTSQSSKAEQILRSRNSCNESQHQKESEQPRSQVLCAMVSPQEESFLDMGFVDRC